jgi:hypothetical protein
MSTQGEQPSVADARSPHTAGIAPEHAAPGLLRLLAPGALLRVEGAALLAAAVAFYFVQGGGWLPFVLLLLVPDLAALGYLANARVGSALYNLAHTTTLPLALLAGGLLTGATTAALVAAIWLTHIGMDRLLGYGLKYPTTFKDTHLGRV